MTRLIGDWRAGFEMRRTLRKKALQLCGRKPTPGMTIAQAECELAVAILESALIEQRRTGMAAHMQDGALKVLLDAAKRDPEYARSHLGGDFK